MELINTYTRAQALKDGQQFNTDSLVSGLANESGIPYPVYITLSVKHILDEALQYGNNDISGILWDIFSMFRHAVRRANFDETLSFHVTITWKHRHHKLFRFYAEFGAVDIDNPKTAITIMTKEDL
ncbi:MAG: hypothetical protein K0R14_788 [Burkholderiales bacterium]|jgi:hypothetical protein|nr:hypothetical protein [Burkholderiales bacterium]